MRGTPTSLGGCPAWRRHMKRQEFPDRPTMIGDPRGHRWRLLATCHAQTLVRRTEVIDGADQIRVQSVLMNYPAASCEVSQGRALSVRHHGFSRSSLYKVTSEQAPRNLLIDTYQGNANRLGAALQLCAVRYL